MLFPNFGLFHPFKGTISNLHTVTSSCILISRHDHVLGFISIHVWTNSLTSDYQIFCVFHYSMYAVAQYINIISILELPTQHVNLFKAFSYKRKKVKKQGLLEIVIGDAKLDQVVLLSAQLLIHTILELDS